MESFFNVGLNVFQLACSFRRASKASVFIFFRRSPIGAGTLINDSQSFFQAVGPDLSVELTISFERSTLGFISRPPMMRPSTIWGLYLATFIVIAGPREYPKI